MIDRPCRRFSVGDAMIFVAALAAAFAWLSAEPAGYYTKFWIAGIKKAGSAGYEFVMVPTSPAWLEVTSKLWEWTTPAIPFATTTTLAMLAIRLRRPRAGLRRLTRQPGMVAVSAASAVIAANAAYAAVQMAFCGLGLSYLTDRRYYGNPAYLGHLIGTPETIGPAVLAASSILILGGRRRPERGWIDRSGRLVGLTWLTLMLLNWAAWRLS